MNCEHFLIIALHQIDGLLFPRDAYLRRFEIKKLNIAEVAVSSALCFGQWTCQLSNCVTTERWFPQILSCRSLWEFSFKYFDSIANFYYYLLFIFTLSLILEIPKLSIKVMRGIKFFCARHYLGVLTAQNIVDSIYLSIVGKNHYIPMIFFAALRAKCCSETVGGTWESAVLSSCLPIRPIVLVHVVIRTFPKVPFEHR